MNTTPKRQRPKNSPYSRPRENFPMCGLCGRLPESKPGEPCRLCLARYTGMITPKRS